MMRSLLFSIGLVLGIGAIPVTAVAVGSDRDPAVRFVDDLPHYAPSQAVSGVIRLWGHGSPKHDFMGRLVDVWIAGFGKYQPSVTFENHMYGTASAMGPAPGAGDIALLGEEISPAAMTAFIREKHYAPTHVDIATGSLDVNYFDYAHMIFVHKDNPITGGLTLPAARRHFWCGASTHGSSNIRSWGSLGLTGNWARIGRFTQLSWQTDVDFGLFLFRGR